jgi:hypothetical protein
MSVACGLAEAVRVTCFAADSGQHVMQRRLPDLYLLLGTGYARAKRSALECEIGGVDQPRSEFRSGDYAHPFRRLWSLVKDVMRVKMAEEVGLEKVMTDGGQHAENTTAVRPKTLDFSLLLEFLVGTRMLIT